MTREGELVVPAAAIVLVLNEEANLPQCLDSLKAFKEVVVVDSYSDDGTQVICGDHGVKFVQNSFMGHGEQRNWALDNIESESDWILFLDADERVPLELAKEIASCVTDAPSDVGAYRVRRRFHMWGRWLKFSSLYPTWVVRLVHRRKVRYFNRGHAETQEVEGHVLDLQNDLIDENHKGLDDWFERQNRYSTEEARYELDAQRLPLNMKDFLSQDPLVRRAALKRLAYGIPARPLMYFLYSYIWKRGFLDGRDGFMFCRMRAWYQGMIVAKKHDLRRRG